MNESNPSAWNDLIRSNAEDPRRQLHDAARRLARHRQELSRLEALADEERVRINAWLDDVSHGERQEILRLENEIEAWAREHRDAKTKSWTTPWGKVTTTATKGKSVIDDEPAFRAWAEANGYAEPQPSKLLIGEVKKNAMIEMDTGRLMVKTIDSAGDTIEVSIPGIHVESDEAFNVNVEGIG